MVLKQFVNVFFSRILYVLCHNMLHAIVSETDSVSSQPLCGTVSALTTLTAPVHVEAEELRRQQLEIEREVNRVHVSHLFYS